MIRRYTNHSANERTYLAWIRTAITVMAFGFVIEKFDLFLTVLSQSTNPIPLLPASRSVELIGLSMFVISIVMIVTSTIRFLIYMRMTKQKTVSVSHSPHRYFVIGFAHWYRLFLAGFYGFIACYSCCTA